MQVGFSLQVSDDPGRQQLQQPAADISVIRQPDLQGRAVWRVVRRAHSPPEALPAGALSSILLTSCHYDFSVC